MNLRKRFGLIGLVTAVTGIPAVAFLYTTTPASLGPVGTTAWFVLVLGALSGMLTFALYTIKAYLRLHDLPADRLAYSWRQGFLMASGLTIFMGLSSLRQLSLRDVVLITILLALIEFYLRARQKRIS